MSPPYKVNAAQLAALRWIASGSPAIVMDGYSHRVSAAALRSRGLVKISGRGPTWRATITDAGRTYLSPETSEGDQTGPPDHPIVVDPGAVRATSGRELVSPARPPQNTAVGQPDNHASIVVVPSQLRGAHPVVLATRDAATGLRAEHDGRIRIGPQPGVIHMVLSRQLLRRALLVVQGLLREAVRRDWRVVTHARSGYTGHLGVAIEVRDHRYPIEVHELTETIPFTDAEIAAWRAESSFHRERRANQMPPAQRKRKRATGQLRLLLPNGYGGGRASWAEGPRGPLESKLASVFRTLEERATADDLAAIKHARLTEERQRQHEVREAEARRIRIENARMQRLLEEVAAWRSSADVRGYVNSLEQKLPSLDPDERDRVANWCSWAKDWADRSDPSVHTTLVAGLREDDGSRH